MLPRNIFHPLLKKNELIIDENQVVCARAHAIVHENNRRKVLRCVRKKLSLCERLKGVGEVISELHKLGDTELLGAAGEQVGMKREEWCVGRQQLAQADAQHLSPLVEGGLNNALEEFLVAAQMGDLVARHAYDGALHLRRRVEDGGRNGEEILHVIPCLDEHRQDAVLLRAWLCGHAQGHFVLYHTRAAGYEVAVVEHFEENLRGDVVGIVAREHKLLAVEQLMQVHAEEVAGDDRGHTILVPPYLRTFVPPKQGLLQILHTLAVYLHHAQRAWLLGQILCQHAHTWAYLKDGQIGTGIDGVGYALRYRQVGEEVLSKVFLRSYLLHRLQRYE